MTSDITLIRIKYPHTNLINEDFFMPDEQANNEQGSAEALPSADYILKNWITTKQAGAITGLSPITVRRYCREGRFHATDITGTWLIDPEHKSLTEFRKTRRGNQGRNKKE